MRVKRKPPIHINTEALEKVLTPLLEKLAAPAAYLNGKRQEDLGDQDVGTHYPTDGVYLGRFAPKGRDGKSLGKTFNVFAAPKDLGTLVTYAEAQDRLAQMLDFHGQAGAPYEDDAALTAALQDGSYKGGWTVPPREILSGSDPGAMVVTDANLLEHYMKGSFRGTFNAATSQPGTHVPGRYWSCTAKDKAPDAKWCLRFPDASETFWDPSDGLHLSCRLVRFVPLKI